MEKDIVFGNETSLRFKEVKTPLNMEDYTGDNAPSKCFNIDKNEYALSSDNEEFFASIDDDTVIVSIKDDSKLFIKGDFDALEAFSFLYQNDFLESNELYVISNNDFDIDTFRKLREEITKSDTIYYLLNDREFEYCINVTEDDIKLSTGDGDITDIKLQNLDQIKTR